MVSPVDLPWVLVGPPAVGKTTVGRTLARRFRRTFYDLDELIESQFRVSIPKLFSEGKESYFRLLERQTLEALFKRTKPALYVLATGGGTILHRQNRDRLRQLGWLFYLQSTSESIRQRLDEDPDQHPQFQHLTVVDLRNLLKERDNYYKDSDWVIETAGKSSPRVCSEIIRRIHGQRGQ